MSHLFSLYMYRHQGGAEVFAVRSQQVLQAYLYSREKTLPEDAALVSLAGSLPFWAAAYLKAQIHLPPQRYNISGHILKGLLPWGRDPLVALRRQVRLCLKELGLVGGMRRRLGGQRVGASLNSYRMGIPTGQQGMNKLQETQEEAWDGVRSLVQIFAGRKLREPELFRLAWETRTQWIPSLPWILELACLSGQVQQIPGVIYMGGGQWQCSRCGERRDIVFLPGVCPTCGSRTCPVCRACITMGEVRGCQPLYVFSSGERQRSRPTQIAAPVHKEPCLSFELSGAQAAAYKQLEEFLDCDYETSLVWAVCGAGKTEAVFGAIARSLRQGERVLFAVPRREVVLELVARIKAAFPSRTITVLVGGRRHDGPLGQLVIATTHQALRLAGVFGLVVLDEADAFPYSTNPALMRAVQRCVGTGGKQIIMTATPSQYHLDSVRKGRWQLVVIPVRHHGRPLPLPRVYLHHSWAKAEWAMDEPLFPRDLEEKVTAGRLYPLLVFVPTLNWGKDLFNYLRRRWQNAAMEYVYSGREGLSDIKEAFCRGKLNVLVTTSILSRGITVPGVNVLITRADAERIFTCASLVQMAGRAGRTADRPSGEVWFLGSKLTLSMKEAVSMIERANKKAQSLTGRIS